MAGTARCRSTTGCSPMRAAARWRSRCTRAIPPTARPSCPQVQRVRERFGIAQLVMVGDRGMISQKAIDELRGQATASTGSRRSRAPRSAPWSSRAICSWACSTSAIWSSSLRRTIPASGWWPAAIRRLAKLRAHKREESAGGHRGSLRQIKARVDAGRLVGAGQDRRARGQGHQPVQGGQALRADHRRGELQLRRASTTASPPRRRWTASTSFAPRCDVERMDAPECVRNYKALANVERAFRSLKTVDLKVRPIHHRTGRSGARAHLPVHAGLLRRVAHARGLARTDVRRHRSGGQGHARSGGAGQALGMRRWPRLQRHTLDDGTPAHSFATLLAELATIVRNTCRTPSAGARCADLRSPHHAQPTATARLRADPAHPAVVRNPNPESIANG